MFFFSKDVDFNDIAMELDRIMIKKIVPLIERHDEKSDNILGKELVTLLQKVGKLRIVTDKGKPTFAFEPQYCYSTAESFRHVGKYLDAIAWYLMSCTRECDFSSPYTSIAGILKEYEKYNSAFAVYEYAEKLFSGDYRVNVRMAILLYFHIDNRHRKERFIEYMDKAQGYFSDYEGLKYGIRSLYNNMYDLDRMFSDYEMGKNEKVYLKQKI
jgi:hypothetical protein